MYTRAKGVRRRTVQQGWTDDGAGLCVHFIGIGGSGMNAAASLLLDKNMTVSGTDRDPFAGMGPLVAGGARVVVGHDEAHLHDDAELVVISAAIPEHNPELAAARARGLPVIKYAELVAEIMDCHKCGIAIAGTHGKSTTTALCAHLLRESGLDPTFLIGATSQQLGGGGGVGSGRLFVAESCEFDRSFLHLSPTFAVILNVEPDHLDCYRDIDDIVEAFSQFSGNVKSHGLVVYNGDDPCATIAATGADCLTESYSVESDSDVGLTHSESAWQAVNLQAINGCYAFSVLHAGKPYLSSRLTVPGRFSVANAMAAVAIAHHAGADPDAIAKALPSFAGVDRRMTLRGEWRGVTLVDDYAHHPTEIRLTLEATRRRYRPKRTVVVFQPHQQARTQHFMSEFAASFGDADEVIVPDIYGAREVAEVGPAPSTDKKDARTSSSRAPASAELVERMCKRGVHARYVPRLRDVAEHVLNCADRGDLVVTMGAGDVWKVADELVERFRNSDGA